MSLAETLTLLFVYDRSNLAVPPHLLEKFMNSLVEFYLNHEVVIGSTISLVLAFGIWKLALKLEKKQTLRNSNKDK